MRPGAMAGASGMPLPGAGAGANAAAWGAGAGTNGAEAGACPGPAELAAEGVGPCGLVADLEGVGAVEGGVLAVGGLAGVVVGAAAGLLVGGVGTVCGLDGLPEAGVGASAPLVVGLGGVAALPVGDGLALEGVLAGLVGMKDTAALGGVAAFGEGVELAGDDGVGDCGLEGFGDGELVVLAGLGELGGGTLALGVGGLEVLACSNNRPEPCRLSRPAQAGAHRPQQV